MAARSHQFDGLVIGGDFNLVASPLPLDILRLDGQGLLGPHASGDLQDAEPLHLDGRDAYTWYDADSSFTPGKLDYVLTGVIWNRSAASFSIHPMSNPSRRTDST